MNRETFEQYSEQRQPKVGDYVESEIGDERRKIKGRVTGVLNEGSGFRILDERSRRIIETRWLRDADDGGTKTLQELADEYGVSAERIRQIEAKALKKMRGALAEYA